MYPKGIINIYSINANKVLSKIPGDIFNVSIIAIKKIHEKGHADWYLDAGEYKQIGLANHLRVPSITISVSVDIEME